MFHLSANPSLSELIKAGALGRSLKRIAAGWKDDAIIMNLESAFPGADPPIYKQIVALAHDAALAAKLQQELAPNQRLNEDDIPFVPPG